MGNKPALFRQCDLERATRAAVKLGQFVKINLDGSMVLLPLSLAGIAGISPQDAVDGDEKSDIPDEVETC